MAGSLYSDMDFPGDRKLVFYGVGEYARDFVQRRCVDEKRIPLPHCFCDDKPESDGKRLFGVPILPFEKVKELYPLERLSIVVLALGYANLIIPARNAGMLGGVDVRIGKCLDMRLELDERIKNGDFDTIQNIWADDTSRRVFDFVTTRCAEGEIWFRNIFQPNQYFGNDVVPIIKDEEIYIAVGAHNGEDIHRWIAMNSNFARVVAFEPDQRVFPALAAAFSDPRIDIRPQGVGDTSGNVYFDTSGICGTVTGSESKTDDVIKMVTLDDAEIDRPTLISMDVEGGEAAAIRGGQTMIRSYRPRLCISAYHRVSDVFELPRQIQAICPEYKFHLRHHSLFATDTTLYAVLEE